MKSFGEDVAVNGLEAPLIKNLPPAVDNTSSVEYSVMFYYTPEFASITTDIPGYVDQGKGQRILKDGQTIKTYTIQVKQEN